MKKYLTQLLLKQFGDKDELLKFIVKDVFNGVLVEDILRFMPDGTVRYKNKKLDDIQIVELQESAQGFTQSVIWQILKNEVKYRVTENLYRSPDWNGIVFGRAMMHAIDTFEERLAQIANLKIK